MDFSFLAKGVYPESGLIPDPAQVYKEKVGLEMLARTNRAAGEEEQAKKGAEMVFADAQSMGWEKAYDKAISVGNVPGARLALELQKKQQKMDLENVGIRAKADKDYQSANESRQKQKDMALSTVGRITGGIARGSVPITTETMDQVASALLEADAPKHVLNSMPSVASGEKQVRAWATQLTDFTLKESDRIAREGLSSQIDLRAAQAKSATSSAGLSDARTAVVPQLADAATANAAANTSRASTSASRLANSLTGAEFTPDAIDLAAQQYLRTGTLPPLYRDAASRKEIINRAASLQRDSGGDMSTVPGDRAAFSSDKASLTQLTKRHDALEQSAKKINNDINTLMGEIDPGNFGGPTLVNRPINYIRTQFSSPSFARYQLAAQIVATEYERMINGGLLSIAQLHEGAREDAKKILNGSMSPAEIRAVVPLMRQEIDNNRMAFSEQLKETRGRMGGSKPSAASESAPRPALDGGGDIANRLMKAGKPYEPNKYDYRIGPDDSVQQKAK